MRRSAREDDLNRREALGLLLAGGLIVSGRMIRKWLLMGPDGIWREPMFLSSLIPRTPVEPDEPPAPDPPFAVNLVSADTLVYLPGVGPVLAERIVQSRRDEGPFLSPADLSRVKGIGPKLTQRLAPLLRFHTTAGRESGLVSSRGDTCR